MFLLVPILTFSQYFKIAEPYVDEFKAEIKRANYSQDIIDLSLTRNYDSISKKQKRIYYDYPDYSTCSFYQDFKNGINYSIEQQREAGVASISLVIPKTDRLNLINWIEGIFKSSPMDIEHNQNSDKSKYGLIDNGADCHFEIKETDKNTIMKNYCRC